MSPSVLPSPASSRWGFPDISHGWYRPCGGLSTHVDSSNGALLYVKIGADYCNGPEVGFQVGYSGWGLQDAGHFKNVRGSTQHSHPGRMRCNRPGKFSGINGSTYKKYVMLGTSHHSGVVRLTLTPHSCVAIWPSFLSLMAALTRSRDHWAAASMRRRESVADFGLCGKFRPLCGTFLAILPAWNALSGHIRNFANE